MAPPPPPLDTPMGGAPWRGAQGASIFYMFSSAMELFHAYTMNKIGFILPITIGYLR